MSAIQEFSQWEKDAAVCIRELRKQRDELLEACKEALLTLEAINETTEGPMAIPSPLMQRIEDVINKAEGKL